jgi:hypothetical protein
LSEPGQHSHLPHPYSGSTSRPNQKQWFFLNEIIWQSITLVDVRQVNNLIADLIKRFQLELLTVAYGIEVLSKVFLVNILKVIQLLIGLITQLELKCEW